MFDDEFLDATFQKVSELQKASPASINIERRDNSFTFTYSPQSKLGFEVDFLVQSGEYWISCEGWHEHSEYIGLDANAPEREKAQRAIDQLITLLNGQASLEVYCAGRMAYKWAVCFDGSRNMTGLLFYPFWAKRTVKKLKNNVELPALRHNPWE